MATLLDWTEDSFLRNTEGSPIRRIGHVRWLRNVAVALGNALAGGKMSPEQRSAQLAALARRVDHPDALVREHVAWALEQATPTSIPISSLA